MTELTRFLGAGVGGLEFLSGIDCAELHGDYRYLMGQLAGFSYRDITRRLKALGLEFHPKLPDYLRTFPDRLHMTFLFARPLTANPFPSE